MLETPLTEFDTYLSQRQSRLTQCLSKWLPDEETIPIQLHKAMNYAVMNGGKRVRPLLVYATGDALGVDAPKLDTPAVAVELIHTYSLIHDDLPAMDDDDLRRGKATCHKAFNEATAILAGDALQSLAIELLADAQHLSDSTRLRMIHLLMNRCGSRGMTGGQELDLTAEGHVLSIDELEQIHCLKTGALIRTCVEFGILAAESDQFYTELMQFAANIGLAFQIQDDILDELTPTHMLGKTQGADRARTKPTYPAIIGIQAAKKEVKRLYEAALSAIEAMPDSANKLRELATYIVMRDY